jgi:DNA-binding transcriptional LysR family regulator
VLAVEHVGTEALPGVALPLQGRAHQRDGLQAARQRVDPVEQRRAARNSADATPGISFVPNTPTAVLRVELGLGVSILPRSITTTAFQGVPIRVCELSDLETRFDLVAIYRKDNQQQTLLNFLSLIK